ncbi:MAG: ATP-binding protein, partial [Candidatus Binatia bacterium]
RRIQERTGGNPFFIEELVQGLAESGSLEGAKGAYRLVRPVVELALPATVQAVLAARIDRLPEAEKETLQTAAVIGRVFVEAVLRRVTERSETELDGALRELGDLEFVHQEAVHQDTRYSFKHALTREVAYNSLLNERRLALHERAGEAIETIFSDRIDEHLSELAHHYGHSRNTRKAYEYSRRAGERAVQLSANTEAITLLRQALKLLETFPETNARAEQEIALLTTLAVPLLATRGNSATEVGDAYARARELCVRTGETAHLFTALRGLWNFHFARGDVRTARQLAVDLLAIGEAKRDPSVLVEAHFSLGATLFWIGDFTRARDHCDRAVALYDPRIHRSHAFVYGRDPGVNARSHLALSLWRLGYPDRALAAANEALASAHADLKDAKNLLEELS